MALETFSERLNRLHNQSGQSQQSAVEMIRRKTKEDIHQTSFGNWLRADREPQLSSIHNDTCRYI
jgi:hypothetical protein